MAPTSRVRPRLGDVIEIKTPRGLAYAQYTHKNPLQGALLRVLPGFFPSRPSDFAALVAQRELFLVFFPLGAACHRKIVSIVAEEEVPPQSRQFPTFRHGYADADGHVALWTLWNGEREWRVTELSPEEQQLPLRPGTWNDTLLIERIAEGWRPSERDLRPAPRRGGSHG